MEGLPWLFAGVTLLYLGAAFLNDAFDVAHDRQWRRERPIPSGAIGLKTVWRTGIGFLVAGSLVLWVAGPTTGVLGLVLVSLIVLYNAAHHLFPGGAVVAGACRWVLYAIGASVAWRGVTGWALWCGLSVGCYIAGTLCLPAQRENSEWRYWPVLLLACPILLAFVLNANAYREPSLLLSAVLGIWMLRCLRYWFWRLDRQPKRALEGLAVGVVFADWLAACPVVPGHHAFYEPTRGMNLVFLALFTLSLGLHHLNRNQHR